MELVVELLSPSIVQATEGVGLASSVRQVKVISVSSRTKPAGYWWMATYVAVTKISGNYIQMKFTGHSLGNDER